MVLLAGEAGVGKTALVRAFGERQPSVAVLAGGCEPLFTPRPLGPLLDIAAEVGGELAELTERGASAGEVLVALGRARCAARRSSSWRICTGPTRRRSISCSCSAAGWRGMPALVIATYRDDELARDHPLRVVLGELRAAHRMHGRAAVAGRRGAAGRAARRRRRRRCTLAPAATRSS